jgi:nucleotide-binding universal stress UspA family protein
MISHALIPLDGSPLAEKALVAARQVLKSDGRFTLVTAISPSHLPQFGPRDETADNNVLLDSTGMRARDYMDRMAHNLRLHGYQVEIEILHGEPADVILRVAEEKRADMIVMSTHGRSGLSRVLFGSVTLKVLGAALMPVLIVPNREREEVPDTPLPSTDPGLAI